jgi:hypothetical protein
MLFFRGSFAVSQFAIYVICIMERNASAIVRYMRISNGKKNVTSKHFKASSPAFRYYLRATSLARRAQKR